MKKKNKKIAAVLTIIILLVAGVVFFYEPDEKRPPSLSGKLKNTEADVENNTYRFEVILSNNESKPELKRDNLRMHMDVTYDNGTEDTFVIFRYREEYNESDKFSFTYIDENEDGLISTGDILDVHVNLNITEVKYLSFSFGTKSYGGTLTDIGSSVLP